MRALFRPLLLLAGLGVTFFGGLLFCATHYPAGYDWRHTVMSSLASPRQDPAHYRIAAYGMAAGGVFLSLLGLSIRRTLRGYAPRATDGACCFFVLGGVLLTVSALVTPGHHALWGLAKAHAKIAQAAGVAFGLGMALDLPAILRLPRRKSWVRASTLLLVVLPMSAYLLCRIFLPTVEASAAPAARQAIEHSILGSLAFWEWIGSSAVYLFVAILVLALDGKEIGSTTPARPDLPGHPARNRHRLPPWKQ